MDKRKPSETTDRYWLVCLNEEYVFSKPREERSSGKWLIFEHISEIDATWEKIKAATKNGMLGPSSKVSTAKPNPNAFDVNTKVICVFTEDYNNKADVKRIRDQIRKLEIPNKLTYKLDKDVGKYEKDGHYNLVKETHFSTEYHQLLKRLRKNTSNDKIYPLQGSNDTFVLERRGINLFEFSRQIIELKKLGFVFDADSSNEQLRLKRG